MKRVKLNLTKAEVNLLILALPYVGDREIEEEIDDEKRIGEKCDALADKLQKKVKA